MPRYLLFSHDGFGLGHVRRNSLIARSLVKLDPAAEVTIVTGTATQPGWLQDRGFAVVRVPPLLKDPDGSYRHPQRRFEDVLAQRAWVFNAAVERIAPHVVLVDRHPYGIGGELRVGLERARRGGARLVIGLRDVLDEPVQVRAELNGAGWDGVGELFDAVLIYGERALCDHEREYGLALTPHYCGLVAPDPAPPSPRIPRQLVIAAGGGADGSATFELGLGLLALRPRWRAVALAGPFANQWLGAHGAVTDRVQILQNVHGCAPYFASASARVQMAGYNSSAEALVGGVRPILVPRRNPRREQAIRASRLAAMGLADVVDEAARPEEVAWLLDRPRHLDADTVARAGLRLDGAQRAAERLMALATEASLQATR